MKVDKLNEDRLVPVICYKTKEPVYYNKGTQWERTEDHFLMYYFGGTKEQAQEWVDDVNKNHPEKDSLGHTIDWDKIDYFYVDEQEEMY